ncbi:MAG: DUF4124 domain-containing protein [Gammaproteobacteria bacterium]
MRSLALLACLLTGMALANTEVFRWVDEDGVVHFSDLPQEGAEKVDLPDAQTFSAPQVQPRASRRSTTTAGTDEAAFRYEEFEFVNPGQEEVLWNIEGQLDVSMRLQPRLQTGHQVSLYLDDEAVPDMRRNRLQVTLTELGRGVHVLRAEIRDVTGQVLIKTQPRTFSVQQTSILNPNNPANRPIPTPLPSRP